MLGGDLTRKNRQAPKNRATNDQAIDFGKWSTPKMYISVAMEGPEWSAGPGTPEKSKYESKKGFSVQPFQEKVYLYNLFIFEVS